MDGREQIMYESLKIAEDNNYTGIMLLPTGSGKGRIMIEVAKKLDSPTILYLCDNTNLRDVMFKEELEKWNASYLTERITFSCYQTAYKWENVSFDLILADEFDAALTPEYSKVFTNIGYKHRLCMSATLDDGKRKLAKKVSPIIYEKTLQEFIDRGILNNVKYYTVNYNLTDRENYQYISFNKEFKSLLSEYAVPNQKALEFLKIRRKQFLSSTTNGARAARWVADTVKDKPGSTLIFCGLSKQADKISPYSYHSKSTHGEDILAKFNSGEINELAVVEKITRGVNLNNVNAIIHDSISTSKTKFTQKTGRGMRLAADDTLNVFFLCPHYRHPFHGRKPTIVEKWIQSATVDINLTKITSIDYT